MVAVLELIAHSQQLLRDSLLVNSLAAAKQKRYNASSAVSELLVYG